MTLHPAEDLSFLDAPSAHAWQGAAGRATSGISAASISAVLFFNEVRLRCTRFWSCDGILPVDHYANGLQLVAPFLCRVCLPLRKILVSPSNGLQDCPSTPRI